MRYARREDYKAGKIFMHFFFVTQMNIDRFITRIKYSNKPLLTLIDTGFTTQIKRFENRRLFLQMEEAEYVCHILGKQFPVKQT